MRTRGIGTRSSFALALALALAISVARADAGDELAPWRSEAAFQIAPAKLLAAAQADPDPPDMPAVELFEDHTYVYDAEGRQTSRHRVIYKILRTGASERWTTILRTYDPWYESKPSIRARVVTPDGASHDLKSDAIVESPFGATTPMVFSERRILKAPLPGVVPGCVVEIESARTETAPYFAGGTVELLVLQREVPIRGFRASIEYPASLPLEYRVRGLDGMKAERATRDDRVILSLTNDAVDAVPEFPRGAPPDIPIVAHLAWSTGASWNAVARDYAAIVGRQIAGADLAAWIAPARKGAANKEALVSALVSLLHREVRYTGVEIKDASIVPRKPGETLKRKYGDCKDKSALLVAMLRAAGLRAEVALVASGADPDPDVDLPGLDSFNHAIVRVEDPPLWIDATDEYAKPGVLGYGVEGRMSLIASPTTEGLVRLPRSGSQDNRLEVDREVVLAELGPAHVVQTTRGAGIAERNQRAQIDGPDAEKVRAYYAEASKQFLHAERAVDASSGDPKNLGVPFVSQVTLDEASFAVTDQREAVVRIPFSEIAGVLMPMLPPPVSRATRTIDFLLPWAVSATTRYTIRPAAGYGAPILPDPVEGHLGPAEWRLRSSAEADGTVTVELALDTVRSQWTAAELQSAVTSVQKLAEREPAVVTFEQLGWRALEEGRFEDALANFRSLAERHPAEAVHRSDLAMALLECGLGDAAREEARRAVALEPESAPPYRALGGVLLADRVGRLGHEGFDRDGAEAAFRKAKELDPSDPHARIGLGEVFSLAPNGAEVGPGTRLDAAIAELASVRDELGSDAADDLLATTLVQAGRWDELKRRAPKCSPSLLRNAAWVAGLAASESTAAAIAQAGRFAGDVETKRLVLQAAGYELLTIRRWAEAGALFAEAARGTSPSGEDRALATLVKKTRRLEDAFPDDTTKRAVAEFLLALTHPDPVVAVAKCAAGAPRRPFDDARIRRIRDTLFSLGPDEVFPAPIPMSAIVDVVAASAEWRVDADGAAGRVSLIVAPTEVLNFSVYTVSSGGPPKVVAVVTEPDVLGEEAMRRVAAGDLGGAARWLGWAADGLWIPPDGDPLSVPSFLLFWGDNHPTDADRLRIAAAALVANGPGAASALQILEEGASRAKQPQEVMRFDRAIAEALTSLKRWDALVPVTERLRRSFPGSKKALHAEVGALLELKRWSDIEALVSADAGLQVDASEIFETKVRLASRRGQWNQVVALLRDAGDDPKTDRWALNQLAWAELMTGKVTERTLALATRAAEGSRPTSESLHTLSAVQAELGRPGDAKETILRSLDARRAREPGPNDWYVIGRIAEDYGEWSAATTAYQRVLDGDAASVAEDCQALARRRMKALVDRAKDTATPAEAASVP